MRGEFAKQSASAVGTTAIPPIYTSWLEGPVAVAGADVPLPPLYVGGAANAGTAASTGAASVAQGSVPVEGTSAPMPVVEEMQVERATIGWESTTADAETPVAAGAAIPAAGAVPPTTGREVVSVAPATAVAHDLAARLEAIARRLRTDGTAAVVEGMRGDRFDALLAGLFAGYLAARDLDS